MIPIQVHFVTIPRETWDSWPLDRPFAHLANDLLGIDRRIGKGVDIPKERMRYKQLCDWIESRALELVHDRRATSLLLYAATAPDGASAHGYVNLIEHLQTVAGNDAPSVTRQVDSVRSGSVARHAIGKTIYPPGKAVSEQRDFFQRLAATIIVEQPTEAGPAVRAGWLAAAEVKSQVYRQAEQDGAAIIEVITMRP